ncbi:ABC transporter permease subunit, partial [Acidimicrobiaceae bacterium USS-CC1]|nr:ABC transporter permease subunit [Acidiferrimicrobium australe]
GPAVVRLEVRRLLRNRRTLIFTVIAPTLFFLIFGLNGAYADLRAGRGNVSASVLISMALYGAVLATTSGGATVSLERAAGWTRTLRVTPLSSAAYIAVKMVASLVLGSASVAVVYVVGAASGKPAMPLWVWIVSAVATWIGSLVFTAFGLFVGYLLPSENVMQIIGFTLMLFSFGGGLFIPLSQYSPALRTLAEFTPLWGLNGLVHFPLMGGAFDVGWVANLLAWLVLFSLGAVWRFSRATSRV